MKKIVLIVVLIGILIGLGIVVFETGGVPSVITNVIDHFRSTPEEGVIAVSGTVEVTEVNVGFTLSGRIMELSAEEGQQVKKDDHLAMLDNAELKSTVAQNQAYLDEALVKLEDLKTGARSQEIEEAKANVKAIEAELSRAKKDFERANALYQQNLIPVSQLDSARSAYNSVVARHKQASEQLSLIKEGPTQKAIQAAEYRVEQAKAALQASAERLKNTRIYTPIAGVILSKNAEVGEIIAAGTPVYTIGDLDQPWVKVYIKEDKLGLVKLGQKAQVTIDSFPGKVYEGTLSQISSEAEFTPKTIQTQEERVKLVFGVKVRVNNINQELKPGMPADVKILLK